MSIIEEKENTSLKPFIIAGSLVFIGWIVSAIVIYSIFSSWPERGTFGDSFGAINALFSGLAFAGVIFTILLQRKELALQRKELELTRNELQKSAEAQQKSERSLSLQAKSMFVSARLNALTAVIKNYEELISVGQLIYIDKRAELVKETEQLLKELKEN